MPSREEAWEILNEFTKNPSLIKHALAVESAMRFYARKFGEEEELWGLVGLMHDFDYERYPTAEDHPFRGVEYLREKGWPEEIIGGILAHAEHTGEPRDTLMKKTIFAVDELAGFIVACCLVRPDQKIDGLTPKSVKKKLKDKAFARSVNREDIHNGIGLLDMELDEHIANVIEAMSGIHEELGL